MTRDLDFSRIHRFVFDDLHLMLDVNSGSIHVTDETVDTFLDALEEGQTWEDAIRTTAATYGEEDALDVADGIAELIDEGMLFSWPTTATCAAATASPTAALTAAVAR